MIKKKAKLGALLFSASALLPSVAIAQEAPAEGRGAAAEDQVNGEIVVTAQKREERLLDTPISIGVLGGADLEEGSARAVADVLREVPGLAVLSAGAGKSSIALRGIQGNVGQPTVGYYQDDVPFLFIRDATLPDANAYDLERVEVLRGPQGTLYGAASLSGVVRIITADPDLDDLVIKGRGRISDTHRGGGTNFTMDGAVSVPIIPGKLAIRAVAGYGEYDGYITSMVPNSAPVPQINSYYAENYRVKLLFRPVDELAAKLTYQRNFVHSDAPDVANDAFVSTFRPDLPEDRALDIYNLAVDYDFGGAVLTSSTSYLNYIGASDTLSGTIFIDQNWDVSSFSQEFRLASGGAGPWAWQVGAIYREAKELFRQDPQPRLAAPNNGWIRYESRSTSYAVYGDITRKLFDDRLELTGGLRYFSDEVRMDQQSALNPSAALITGKRSEFDKLTGRAVIAFKPNDDAMFYASYGNGFRSGLQQTPTAQANGLSVGVAIPDAGPDTLTNYEVGAKGSLFDGAVTYETALFFMKWSNIQQSILSLFNGVPITTVVNAGDASGLGAEASITLRPVKDFTINAGVGWNGLAFDQDITQIATILVNGVATRVPTLLFAKGSRVNYSPEWSVALGAGYETAISDRAKFFVNTNFSFSSQRPTASLSGTTITRGESDKISLLSANAGIDLGAWKFSVFGENLMDEKGTLDPGDPFSGFRAVRTRPRTIGLQAAFDF